MDRIEMLGRDETIACWAAMVALVEDVHAPQDQLTETFYNRDSSDSYDGLPEWAVPLTQFEED